MRHSDYTAIRPANDHPRDDRQLDLFGESVFIGADWGREPPSVWTQWPTRPIQRKEKASP